MAQLLNGKYFFYFKLYLILQYVIKTIKYLT